jgi:cell division protease FtsH
MKANFKSIIMLVVMVAFIILAVSFMSPASANDKKEYSEIIELFDKDLVESYQVNESLVITIKAFRPKLTENGDYIYSTQGKVVRETDKTGKYIYETYTYQLSYNFQLSEINAIAAAMIESGETNLKSYDYLEAGATPWYQIYLPYIIIALILGGLWFFMMKQTSGAER